MRLVRAAQLDPACALCFWGVALTVGPNYNLPFLVEERARIAHAALLESVRLAPHSSPVEQALIGALQKRYLTAEPLDPPHMKPVLNAWTLWTRDGKAAPGTERVIATLEFVLARDPHHPGANHY
jgi:hypothetical protein